MNKDILLRILFIIVVISVVIWVGTLSLMKDEERLSGCEELCQDKDLRYYTYIVRAGETFCTCLNGGVENKFALGEVSE